MYDFIFYTIYVTLHTLYNLCYIAYFTQFMLHCIFYRIYVTLHILHSLCYIAYFIQFMFDCIGYVLFLNMTLNNNYGQIVFKVHKRTEEGGGRKEDGT